MYRVSTSSEGTLTFLFTDVEGSTRLARKLGDGRWAQVLEEHRRILRAAFQAHGGREVDAQGDAFFVVFAQATNAALAAIEGQRALSGHDWPEDSPVRIRVGLHTGEAVLRGGHYIGQEVHRASRICDAGHGGQIVASRATAELIGQSLPEGAALHELGPHHLKDLEEPQRLFQLDGPGLRSDFPLLRSLETPHNLPAERSSFVGRAKEIEALRRSLVEHRNVTLTGIGGSGKTRLALRVANLVLGHFRDGAFFVELASVSDPDLLPQTIATSAGISLADSLGAASQRTPEDRLISALAQQECLLVIDNCEHLVDPVADLLDRVLEACPGVTILATSREALGVEGEHITRVPSLSVPDELSDTESAEAVMLFVQRASAAKSDFALDADSREPVAEICRRLDGIPLAIEFAAARVSHLSPRQIADRLQDRFRLLTGGRRRIQRQQTLAGALDWSHDLLVMGEQVLFRRLAVFAGSFGIDATEVICSSGEVSADSVLDILGSLVAKSLVVPAADDAGEARYRLLETVRMYASEKLAGAGEAEAVRQRHRDWYVEWIDSIPLEQLTFAPDGHPATTTELDNLRAAADWCVEEDRPDLLARLVVPLFSFWSQRGAHVEGERRAREILRDETRLSLSERTSAHAVLASILNLQLENAVASEHANRAIDLSAGNASPYLVVALALRGFCSSVSGAFPGADGQHAIDARRDGEAAREVTLSGLSIEWRSHAEYWQAMIEMNLGDFRAAERCYTTLQETLNAAEYSDSLMPGALGGLVGARHLLGLDAEALEAAKQYIGHTELSANLPDWERMNVVDVAPVLVAAGEEKEALQIIRQVGRPLRRSGIPLAANHVFCIAGVVAYLQGRFEPAGRLMAASRYLAGAADLPIPFRTPTSMSLYRRYLPLVREALGPEAAHAARQEGRAMTMDEAWSEALGDLD
jgi:predicted ATPase/class 3 adenylate cyclase